MNLTRLTVPEIEAEARSIETKIKRLAHHPRPTPSERQQTSDLKRMRLAMKDRLAFLTSSK